MHDRSDVHIERIPEAFRVLHQRNFSVQVETCYAFYLRHRQKIFQSFPEQTKRYPLVS